MIPHSFGDYNKTASGQMRGVFSLSSSTVNEGILHPEK
jgi:hypothetical protein